MAECWRAASQRILLTILCIFIPVFQITVQAASISVDASQLRINPLECYDRVKSCREMTENGFCESNYHYMIDRCPWSCRLCRRARGDTEECKDLSKHCSKWVAKKECTTRPDFMAQNCKKSCEMCGPESEFKVSDSESICPIWAKAGWCQKDSDLLQKCPHSCQKYGYMGANSMDERYITVNFQNASSVTAQTITEIKTPPAPPSAISAHSDLDTLPQDLREALEKEWWDEKLLQLTQKQNEYVTHPEVRPPSLPINRNQTAQAGNNTLGVGQTNGTGLSSNQSSTLQDGNQQREMPQPSPPPSSPKAYDSLLPQLALGGLSWTGGNGKQEENQQTTSAAPESKSGVEVWKEEQEEDQDLDEGGQQKGKVPVIVSGHDESSGDSRDLSVEISSSGNDDMQKDGNYADELKASGESIENDDTKAEQEMTSSSGNDDMQRDGNYADELKASGESIENDDTKTEQRIADSGSGEEDEANIVHETMHSSPESGQGEIVRRIFPENNFSGSGQSVGQETSDDILVSSSGSAQYPEDERLEMTTFPEDWD